MHQERSRAGRIQRIDDPLDERLNSYAGVREPRLLREQGLLIAEGRFVVRRLISAGRLRVRSLLLNDAASASLSDVVDGLEDDVEVFVAPASVIAGATGFNIHRGCLALGERPETRPPDELLAASNLVVVLERVVDADNVGSVFRNAEAFGADAVLVSPGCCDPLYRKAIRTSSGAALMVPFATLEPWPHGLDWLTAAGFTIVVMTPDASAMSVGDFADSNAAYGRIAVLFGTEGHGVTSEALARAHVRVRIPMNPSLDSLNIATAAGITLHRLHEIRQARARGNTSGGF